MLRSLLCLLLLLSCAAPRAAQSEKSQMAADDTEEAAVSAARAALLSDLRALESDAKDLLKPLDAASARAEIAAAAWSLDREWAKQLLRDALELTFPDKIDRARLRERPVGGELQPPTPEEQARSAVRGRVMSVADPDREFTLELIGVVGREMGAQQETMQYSRLAGSALREGRVEEAAGYILKSSEADPTFMNTGLGISELAARDRAAADRLVVQYIARLRSLPVTTFIEARGSLARAMLSLKAAMLPEQFAFFRTPGAPNGPPAGRQAFRAYFSFVLDLYTGMEQARPGSSFGAAGVELTTMWPQIKQHAPDLIVPFQQLEAASRRPGAAAPQYPPPNINDSYERRHEEQVKLALKTKDQSNLDFLINRSLSRKDFDDARKLLDIMTDDARRARLAEEADCRESVALAEAGDTARAERLARQLTTPNTILRAYPPLVRRLASNKETSSASLLALEAVARLRRSAESGAGDDTYVPAALASVAGSLRVYKQSRALLAMSELALAVLPASEQAAFDALEALVATANKAPITSESGNPNFNAEVFAKLSASDAGRVRSAASRLEDRLQRIAALAAACRAEARALEERAKAPKSSEEQPPRP